MCLIKSSNLWTFIFPPKYKIAKKDIPVFKYLDKQIIYGSGEIYYVAPFFHFVYTFGKEHTSELGEIQVRDIFQYQVNKGLHSIYDEEAAINKKLSCSKLFKGMIPKGARYMKGKNKEIVSDKLIVFNEEVFISKF